MDPISISLLIGASLLGTGIRVAGDIIQGNAQARAAEQNAEANRLQAQELLRNARLEEERRRLDGGRMLSQQIAQVSGRSNLVGTARMQLLNETVSLMERDILDLRRDARFASDQIEKGALEFQQMSRDIRRSTALGVGSTILTTGVQVGTQVAGRGTGIR